MQYDESVIREKYRRLTKSLIEKGLMISTMESATSGLIASLITDTEGASSVMKGAYVTYSNEAKIMNGVDKEIIRRYSVYSRETATAMAKACRSSYNADIGVGVTGTMGNVDTANLYASVPGQVYFSIDYHGDIKEYYIELPPLPERYAYKLAVAERVVDAVLEILEKNINFQ